MRKYKKIVLPTILVSFFLLVLFLGGEKRSTKNTEISTNSNAVSTEDAIVHKSLDFTSGNSTFDDTYNLAVSEVQENIRDGTFIAGNGWDVDKGFELCN